MSTIAKYINESVKIKREKYSWGELVKIEQGSNFKVIIHPEHMAKIAKLKKGDAMTYRDEQGQEWDVVLNADDLVFTNTKNSKRVKVKQAELIK